MPDDGYPDMDDYYDGRQAIIMTLTATSQKTSSILITKSDMPFLKNWMNMKNSIERSAKKDEAPTILFRMNI